MLRRLLGDRGERIARRYLKRRGYRILASNYRCPLGEIDIVALDGRTVVFVEVKTRSSDEYGTPLEAVGWKKRRKLTQLALYYLKHEAPKSPGRFDVIGISSRGLFGTRVEHVEDAFSVHL